MKKTVVGGLALALLVSMSAPALAQEKKMTRDEYVAQIAELTEREATAKGQIEALNTQIADLNGNLDNCDMAVADLNDQIRTLVDASDEEMMAFGKRLDALTGQLEGLLALPPEVLIQRRGEVKAIAAEVGEMKMSKMAALPEMAMKLANIDKLLGQIKARIAQPITVDYMVERGDNLWNIAKKESVYDDPYMWPRIYRANKEMIKDPDLIYPKQTLAVPYGVAENQHLVSRGDFLFKIAAEVYNDASKWHKIYEANKEQVVEPHLIFPAQVLEIPSN
ncbi:MAG: LysM peptidoglycan-binding domain-containing protein [Candidatus Latescibacterota bacterium]|jgi:nucleoid-associated protein YgaU